MVPDTSIPLSEREEALDWASSDPSFDPCALISKSTGVIYYTSSEDLDDEEPPDDYDDETRFWYVPHKNELDLGRSLALRFVSGVLPDEVPTVESFFRHQGAYSEFKGLLQRRGQLDRWYEFEHRATLQALRRWAGECGIRIVEDSERPAEA